jgi:hypothetical protein
MTESRKSRKNKCLIGESVILSSQQMQNGMAMIENPETSRRTRRSPASEPRTYSVSGCLRRLTTLISIFEVDYLEFPDGTPESLAKEFQSSAQLAVGQLKRTREILLKSSKLCARRKMMSHHKAKREFSRNIQNLVKDALVDGVCESSSIGPSLDVLQLNTMGLFDGTTSCTNTDSDTPLGMSKNAEKPHTSDVICVAEPSRDIAVEGILDARYTSSMDSGETALLTSTKPVYKSSGLTYEVDYTLRDICCHESIDDHGVVTPNDPNLELLQLSAQAVQDLLNGVHND